MLIFFWGLLYYPDDFYFVYKINTTGRMKKFLPTAWSWTLLKSTIP